MATQLVEYTVSTDALNQVIRTPEGAVVTRLVADGTDLKVQAFADPEVTTGVGFRIYIKEGGEDVARERGQWSIGSAVLDGVTYHGYAQPLDLTNGSGNAPTWETPGTVTFAAGDLTAQTLTTGNAVLTANSPSINTAGITWATNNQFTAPAALAGKYISFQATVESQQTSGNDRTELVLILQKFNGSTWDDKCQISNYAQRATSHDGGGIVMAETFDLDGALSGGEQYRWVISKVGSPVSVTLAPSSYTIKVYS